MDDSASGPVFRLGAPTRREFIDECEGAVLLRERPLIGRRRPLESTLHGARYRLRDRSERQAVLRDGVRAAAHPGGQPWRVPSHTFL